MPSFVKAFVTETDPEIDSHNLTPVSGLKDGGWGGCGVGLRWYGVASRIKEGRNEVINKRLFVLNTRNSGPAAIIN